MCLKRFIDIANMWIKLGHWSLHFKVFVSIIIPKPNKELYTFPKAFQSIALLNTIGKLIKKVIGERLEFQSISNKFIHQCQLGGLKQQSTIDIGVMLTHFIHTGWVRNLSTSMLAFNIAQSFFQNYLVGKKTRYF